jgi:hypothetical protein
MNVFRWLKNYKPVTITENFVCCLVAIFFVMAVGACGIFFASLLTDEQGWRVLSGFFAWSLFAVSCYAISMMRECSRFRNFLSEHQHSLPVRAKAIHSWRPDQSGYEVLNFAKGVILFDEKTSFMTSSEWAFKKIMSSCVQLNPAFVRAEIREATFR